MPQGKSFSATLEHLSEIMKNLQQELKSVRRALASRKQNEERLRTELHLAQSNLNRRSVGFFYLSLSTGVFAFYAISFITRHFT